MTDIVERLDEHDPVDMEAKAEITRLRLQWNQWEIAFNQKDAEIERQRVIIREVSALVNQDEDTREIIDAWKTKADQRADRIAKHEAEIEQLRERNTEHEARYEALDAYNDELKAELKRLRASFKECVDDLEQWITHHYQHTLDHPGEKRRFDRDMGPVIAARKLLDRPDPDR